MSTRRFNPPPSWPPVPAGWEPPTSWVPPSDWPALPAGWSLWIEDEPIDPVFASEDVPPQTTDATASSPVADSQLTVTEIERDGVVFVVLPVGRGAGSPVVTIPRSSWTGGSGDRPTVEPSEVQDRAIGSRSTERAVVDPRDQRIASLEAEVLRLRSSTTVPSDGAVPLDDQQVLQSVGIYRYHHPLENAVAYKDRLTVIEAEIAALVREGRAIERSNMFTFDNSLAKGRKMSDDLSKLMLRAYNAEADNAVRSLRAGNVETAKRRLEKSREAIARLGAMMEMRIAAEYHDLRVEEVELTSDWLMRKQEERELERDERARLREEKRVQQELEAERERLDKERALIEQTIERLRENGEVDAVLEARLGQIDAAIQQNDFRAANIRAGYVYVISNRGAFGPDVVKIGLTRRLEPSDRVNELGGASVPFRFDVHTIYFSEDAVSLETELHRHFASRALNQANPRKEFFFATPAEVREVLMQKVGALLEFREDAEATEYLQSVGAWPVRAA